MNSVSNRKQQGATAKQTQVVVDAEDLLVRETDLEHLDVLRNILSTLNDPSAGAGAIAHDLGRLPVLRARIAKAYSGLHEGPDLPPLAQQIARLGNRPVEVILFELLEDLTVLRADVDERNGS